MDAPAPTTPSITDDARLEGPAQQPETPAPAAERYATVMCVANQKGGVGKTTTTVSLAAALALEGAQVLVVDLDPQGNATTGLGLRGHEGAPSTYRVLIDQLAVEDATEPTGVKGLHCVPSSLDLAGAEIELVSVFSREQRLRNALDQVRDLYDVIIVDCPPSLGLLTINALVAADQVLVPIQCEYYALEGLGQLMRTLELVKTNLNNALELGGVVLTMYDARTRLSQQVVDEVRNHFGDTVYDTIIPRTVRLSEAPGFGQPINVFDPASRGARAYQRLGQETATRLGLHLQSEVSPEDGLSALDRLLGSVSETIEDTELHHEGSDHGEPTGAGYVDTDAAAGGPAPPPAGSAARAPESDAGSSAGTDGRREELPSGHADRLRDAAAAALASFSRPTVDEDVDEDAEEGTDGDDGPGAAAGEHAAAAAPPTDPDPGPSTEPNAEPHTEPDTVQHQEPAGWQTRADGWDAGSDAP